MLSDHQAERYARHLVLPEFGAAGQEALFGSRVFVLGAGGLGSVVLPYLVAAGVGRVTVMDDGRVESSNLQRQILYRESEDGQPKAERARDRLQALNAGCRVEAIVGRFAAERVEVLDDSFDLVMDCCDNFPTRFLLADRCRSLGLPEVTGAVVGCAGHVMTVLPATTEPCLRCLMPREPDPSHVQTAKDVGVLGPAVGVIASLQAMEAIKVLAGMGEVLSSRFLSLDLLSMRVHCMNRGVRAGCVCQG